MITERENITSPNFRNSKNEEANERRTSFRTEGRLTGAEGAGVAPLGGRMEGRCSSGGRMECRSSSGGKMLAFAAVFLLVIVLLMPAAAIDPISTLECHRRQYTYKVHKTDDEGRMCWDYINVMSCWGRCDSNEIADWKFPYKRSYHPVCMHEDTQLTEVTLRHCDDNASPGTEMYAFHEATRCSCSVCKSSEAACEGIRYRGARRAPRAPRAEIPRG